MEDKQIGVPTNVAVFIDYENVYKALLEEKTNVLRLAFFEKLRKWCSEHQRRVVRIVVYCNFDNMDLHESFHQSVLQSYGVETVHTSNQGKNYADLKITIDVLSSMYSNNNIDEFFIMSNDKDMTPLLNTIRANKRNVAVITISFSTPENACSNVISIRTFKSAPLRGPLCLAEAPLPPNPPPKMEEKISPKSPKSPNPSKPEPL